MNGWRPPRDPWHDESLEYRAWFQGDEDVGDRVHVGTVLTARRKLPDGRTISQSAHWSFEDARASIYDLDALMRRKVLEGIRRAAREAGYD